MSTAAFRKYLPGAVIRHGERAYAVEEEIGNGKFGIAFNCQDDRGLPRVLQVVWPFSRNYEAVRDGWIGQVADLRRVQHPGLVNFLDGFEHGGYLHLVHERCGQRLDHELGSQEWSGNRRFLYVAGSVLGALDSIHSAGYTHRNLHPRNVFRGQTDGAIKLSDLGVNALLGNVDVLNVKISRWLVPPEYLSPTECGPMDHRVDVYQAGLLLLCLLQGRIVPYSLEDIALGAPARNAERIESFHGQVLARALQPKVTDRFQSALELWNALSGSRPLAGSADP
jgi:serine/threonine protein kinase